MFRAGKVLKVKVELSPEITGFGRATIVEVEAGRIYLQLKTSKGQKRTLPKGTKVWFVSDSLENPFNGLWSTSVIGQKLVHGKTVMECTRPKFEAKVQKRKQRRVALNCPVRVEGEAWQELNGVITKNVSRSGLGFEVHDDCADDFESNHHIDIVIESPVGEIAVTARIVQSRYNWLANRTDVGVEFIKVSKEAQDSLDRLLLSLGGKPRQAPDAKEKERKRAQDPAALSGWLKSTKDNVSFVKMKEHENMTALSEDDIEELETLDDDDESEE